MKSTWQQDWDDEFLDFVMRKIRMSLQFTVSLKLPVWCKYFLIRPLWRKPVQRKNHMKINLRKAVNPAGRWWSLMPNIGLNWLKPGVRKFIEPMCCMLNPISIGFSKLASTIWCFLLDSKTKISNGTDVLVCSRVVVFSIWSHKTWFTYQSNQVTNLFH